MNRTSKNIAFLAIALGAFAPACAGDPPTTIGETERETETEVVGDSPDKPGSKPEDTVGGEENTHDHMDGLGEEGKRDPMEIAAQREEEGTPFQRARMHSCQKMQIAAVRNMLTDFGVNLGATGTPPTAGQLLNDGGTALGQANYAARIGEDIVWTAAGAAKTFDIFVQAAPEIIANIESSAQCQVNGTAPAMFNADDTCNADAVSCLIGRPSTPEHLAICNSIVQNASTVANGKNIAVAAMLSAAHSCE